MADESDEAREVRLPLGGGKSAHAYARRAPHARRGMVVAHELFGPAPEIDRVVDRFAAHGYAAIAPDCFGGKPIALCVRRIMLAMRDGEGPVVEALEAARAWLVASSGISMEQVGLIGFCIGGGFALAAGAGWGAVSTNYGGIPAAERLRGIGPVIGCYGGRDRVFGKAGAVLARRLTRLGVPHETHVFEEAGHSFLTDGHHPVAEAVSGPLLHVGYRPEVAEEAWRRIFAFFDGRLPGGRFAGG